MTHYSPSVRRAATASRSLLAAAAALLSLLAFAPGASAASLVEERVFEPFTPWHQPPMQLPDPVAANYEQLAQAGYAQSARWRSGRWYCEYLAARTARTRCSRCGARCRCSRRSTRSRSHDPSAAAPRARGPLRSRLRALLEPPTCDGYAPYSGRPRPRVEAWFDDNGWLGLAFAERLPRHARAALAARRPARVPLHRRHRAGTPAGGGMWWNTAHPYHSGPALAADSLLGHPALRRRPRSAGSCRT